MQPQSSHTGATQGFAAPQDLGVDAVPARAKRANPWATRAAWTAGLAIPVAVLLILAGRAPAFYVERLHEMPPDAQKEMSERFLKSATRLLSAIVYGEGRWKESFDEASINAWLAEDFPVNHAQLLPSCVRDPRVAIEDDVLHLGFRWAAGPFETVVHISGSVWVPKQNLLAIKFAGASAGMIPLPTSHVRRVLERIADARGCELTWKRHGSELIGLLKLPAGGRNVLRRAEIKNGTVSLSGNNSKFISLAAKPRSAGK
jgi:hypothetical protein